MPVTVTTADGSYGVPGFVTDAMPKEGYTYLYTCGPEPMLRAVDGAALTSGQFGFESGWAAAAPAWAAPGETKYGHKRICREGPVLEREEILW